MNICPICGSATEEPAKTGDAKGFECPQHGKFKVADRILGSDAFLNAARPQWEAALQKARKRTVPDAWPCIVSSDFI
jgi:hypothetical protein